VVRGDLTRTASFQGFLYFPNSAAITVPKKGKLTSSKYNGEYVEEGEVIAEFTVEDASLAIKEAELNYQLAEARLKSDIAAGNEAIRNAATEPDARSARAALEFTKYSGEAAIRRAKEALDAALDAGTPFVITAPKRGFIGSVNFNSGGDYMPGHLFCMLNDPYDARLFIGVEANAADSDRLAMLKINAPVTMRQDRGDDAVFSGHVVSNTSLLGANAKVAPYAIVAFDVPDEFGDFTLSNRNAIGNSLFYVKIDLSDINDVLLCPRKAIQRENTYRFVHLLEDGALKKRYISTGLISGDYYQVPDGLKEGDKVVIS